MKYVQARKTIDASPQTIWSIITNAELLAEAPTGVLELNGEIGSGGKLKLRSEVSPKQVFQLKVTNFSPPTHMIWQGGMPLGLFKGTRTFELKEIANGTQLSMREEFTGPLAGLIFSSMPDLNPSFEKFLNAVKKLSERPHS